MLLPDILLTKRIQKTWVRNPHSRPLAGECYWIALGAKRKRTCTRESWCPKDGFAFQTGDHFHTCFSRYVDVVDKECNMIDREDVYLNLNDDRHRMTQGGWWRKREKMPKWKSMLHVAQFSGWKLLSKTRRSHWASPKKRYAQNETCQVPDCLFRIQSMLWCCLLFWRFLTYQYTTEARKHFLTLQKLSLFILLARFSFFHFVYFWTQVKIRSICFFRYRIDVDLLRVHDVMRRNVGYRSLKGWGRSLMKHGG